MRAGSATICSRAPKRSVRALQVGARGAGDSGRRGRDELRAGIAAAPRARWRGRGAGPSVCGVGRPCSSSRRSATERRRRGTVSSSVPKRLIGPNATPGLSGPNATPGGGEHRRAVVAASGQVDHHQPALAFQPQHARGSGERGEVGRPRGALGVAAGRVRRHRRRPRSAPGCAPRRSEPPPGSGKTRSSASASAASAAARASAAGLHRAPGQRRQLGLDRPAPASTTRGAPVRLAEQPQLRALAGARLGADLDAHRLSLGERGHVRRAG